MKVCWVCNYFSPYAVKRFDELGKELELTIFVLGGKDNNRNNEWDISGKHNFTYNIIDKKFDSKIKECAKNDDVLIDALYVSKYGIKAVSEFKKENKKILMIADGGIAINRGFIINITMSFLMKRHDYFLSSSVITNNYFKYYGVDEKKIINYRFSSLTKNDILNNQKMLNNKSELKDSFNINDKYTILSVGQPIKRKGFDILLKSYMKTGLTDKINLYIVGGEPQKEIKQYVEDNNLINVHFINLIDSNTLKEYYAAADAFALCTREDIWGLVIQEAMSFGLPVITSNNCVAGLHFNKLCKDVYICDVNDVDGYAKKIIELYEINKVSSNCLETIKDYTIENSAKDIIDILNRL